MSSCLSRYAQAASRSVSWPRLRQIGLANHRPARQHSHQTSEEDQAINDATLKALRESRGTNQPSDSIVFKDQDLGVFLDQVYGPLVKIGRAHV